MVFTLISDDDGTKHARPDEQTSLITSFWSKLRTSEDKGGCIPDDVLALLPRPLAGFHPPEITAVDLAGSCHECAWVVHQDVTVGEQKNCELFLSVRCKRCVSS